MRLHIYETFYCRTEILPFWISASSCLFILIVYFLWYSLAKDMLTRWDRVRKKRRKKGLCTLTLVLKYIRRKCKLVNLWIICPNPQYSSELFYKRKYSSQERKLIWFQFWCHTSEAFSSYFFEHEKDLTCLKSAPDMYPIFT